MQLSVQRLSLGMYPISTERVLEYLPMTLSISNSARLNGSSGTNVKVPDSLPRCRE